VSRREVVTEVEFNTCSDPQWLLEFLSFGGQASARKLRLFAVACCRRVEHLLRDERLHWAIGVAERLADGVAKEEERAAAERAAYGAWAMPADAAACDAVAIVPVKAARDAARHAAWAVSSRADARETQAILLRDLVGPLPFRRVAIDASWRTPPVVALATAIYEERAWGDMPILGDALLEAGCEDAEVLEHCRGKEPHTRGCWVVDLVLNQE
jgi:hypothetical protein